MDGYALVSWVIKFEQLYTVQSIQICTWLHYIEVNGKASVLLSPVCRGDLKLFDFPQVAEWIVA